LPPARLDSIDLELHVEAAEVALARAQAASSRLESGAGAEAISAAEAGVEQAEAALRQAEGSVTGADIAAARDRLNEAHARLARLEAGPKDNQVQMAQATVDEAIANLQAQRDALSSAKVDAELQLEQAANKLRDAQDEYSRIYWDNRELEEALDNDIPQVEKDREATALRAVQSAETVLDQAEFGEGMAEGFGQMSTSGDADLLITQQDAVMILMGALDEDVGAQIARMRGVAEVAGSVTQIEQLPETPYFLISGEDPRSFAMQRYKISAGRPLAGKREIMLGKSAAVNFKKQVGDKFRIHETGYEVVGIYETGASLEDNGAVMHLETAQRSFNKRRQVSFFKVRLDNPRDSAAIKQRIEEHWPDLAALRSGDPAQQDDALEMYRSLGWVLGIFAVLVGGLGMMNAMLMSVFERTREIGVLRALGWRRRRVIGMIMSEALMLAVIGGLLGLALGIGTIELAGNSPAVGGLLSGTIAPSLLIEAMVTAIVLGLVGGAYPAWRAARLAPVEAMRAESGASIHWGRFARLMALLARSNAGRNLLRRPSRSLMTMLGLGIGVGFIVAMSGIAEGSRRLFTDMLSAGQSDILVEEANASDAMFSAIDERRAEQLRLHPEVESMAKLVLGTSTAPGMPFFLVYGLDPREGYIQRYRVREGRSIQRPDEIIIGRMAANSLEKGIGERLRLSGGSFAIVGIYETGTPYEDAGGVITLREAQRLFGKTRQVSFVGVTLHDPGRADAVVAQLEAAFPDMLISRTADMTDRMQDFATLDAVFGALLLLMMIVGGTVMMNVMLMSVFERTQEIGVLRAVGWSRRRVLRTVLGESLLLSIFSGLAGIGLGLLLNVLFALTPAFGQFLVAIYTPQIFVQVLLLVLALGAIGGLLPAWRAANLRPVEALRYE
jgi:ABC-type antimicrobial peptide transport system permease subunit